MAASVLRRSDRVRATVLIVEDEEVVRELLGSAFEVAGWKVEHAGTCEGMTRALRRAPIDIVVVDRHLPDGDGWTTASELRQRFGRSDFAVIGITAHLALSNAERALVAGCDAFLEKPCEPQRLIDEATRLLGLREPKTTTRRKRLRDT